MRRVLRLGDARRGVDEELNYHFDRTVEELMSQGETREAAEAEAARRFGDVTRYSTELERIDRAVEAKRRWIDRFDVGQQSLKYAMRSLGRSPGLAIGVIIAFALGIGANLTMYSVVDRLLLSPPEHIAEPEAVKRIYLSEYLSFLQDRYTGSSLSYPDYRQLRDVSAFDDVAAWAPNTVTLGAGLDATEREAVYVTGNFFGMLGVRPAFGRFFGEAEDRIGGAQQVVLSWTAWQRDFGGSSDALGRTVDFGYGPYEVIGVAPERFTGVDLAAVDLWLPFHVVHAQTSGTEWQEDRSWQFFETVARLRDGVTQATAEAEATASWIAGRAGSEFADEDIEPAILLSSVLSARGPEAPPESMVARLLLIVSAIVLLIAAVNVANLLLARSLRQRREIAVRLALGISRRRLIGQIMLEGMLLALAGGVAALLLATWGSTVIGRVLLPDVAWGGGINLRVTLVAAALALVAGGAAALIPALQAARGAVGDTLRQAGAGGVTRRTARVRTGLALLQTALSVLLLVGAGLFVRSLDRVRGADFGFDPQNLVYAIPRTVAGGMPEAEALELAERGRQNLQRVQGVRAAGTTQTLPFHSSRSMRLRAEGVDSIPTPTTGGPYVHEVSAGYIEAMDLDILAGRSIAESDVGPGPAVAVVNESMAQALWPDRSPLGRCLYVGNGPDGGPQTRCWEVVGVVEDSRRREVADVTTFQYYVPIAQQPPGSRAAGVFVIRVADETPATLNAIRRTILDLDPRIRYVEAEPMMSRIDPRTRSWTLGATVFSIFGLLALVVASIGLYSVLSFDVAQRTREIGVRSALGASARAQMRMIVGNALRITAIGVAAGVIAALALAGRIEPLLFEIPPRDPLTFVVVVLALHVVAAFASSIPAWKASRVDPNIALRAD
jgi:predicted permease